MKKILLILLALLSASNLFSQMENSERYTRGWNKLQEIDGEAGEKVVAGLNEISPELVRFIIEYAFGDVYCQPVLDNKSKEVAAVASLIAQGAIPQLKVHLNGALNAGCTVNEVKEIILQMSVYTGFPSCINAMNALKDVLNERKAKGIEDIVGEKASPSDAARRYETGAAELKSLKESQEQTLKDAYDDFSPELVKFTIEYGYGDIFSRDNLDKRYKQIATIAALTTMGAAYPQLKFHMEGALNIGVSAEEIKEIMLLMTVYAGFPAAINGTNALKEVIRERMP